MRHLTARASTRFRRLAALIAGVVATSPAAGQTTLGDAIASGRPLIDVRLRFEQVIQDDKAKDAVATTIRARLGYQTSRA